MIGKEFKSIIFYGADFLQEDYLKKKYSSTPVVKLFHTRNSEELEQILKQSTITTVLINDLATLNVWVEKNLKNITQKNFRTYFLDDSGVLTSDEISRMSLKKVTTLSKSSAPELKNKLDRYILSKVQVTSTNESTIEKQELKDPPKTRFFTHFKCIEDEWTVVASTHEEERDIETLFGRSWSGYCRELFIRARDLSGFEEDPDFSQSFYSIVYSHRESHSLSVIHLRKGLQDFDILRNKAIAFLETI
ncbi:MAG TPA: hypothetical protein VNJ01_08540 [Bacteriovoracaceae bacterium]|nr:hypothetical protein [Bacteriovoracaceae bacterium]